MGGLNVNGIKVTAYDPEAHEARSFTVYPGPGFRLADTIALKLHRFLSARYRTTRLSTRRHRRRLR